MLYRWFHFLPVRERLLLLAFVWVALFAWANNLSRSLRTQSQARGSALELLEIQDIIMAQETAVAVSLNAAREGLDTTRTLTASGLVGRLDNLARASQLDFEINRTNTQETDLFSFHSVRLAVKQAAISDLIDFESKLRQESPYVSLNRFQIRANRRNPQDLDATFEVASFELKAAALE